MSTDGRRGPRDLERFRNAAPSPASTDDFAFDGRDDVSEVSFAVVIATGRLGAVALEQGCEQR